MIDILAIIFLLIVNLLVLGGMAAIFAFILHTFDDEDREEEKNNNQ